MYNSEFEKQVQEKMEGLKMTPSENLWSRIENELPGKPRRNKFILLLLLLLGGCGLVWMTEQVYNKQADGLAKTTKIQQAYNAGYNKNITGAQQRAEKKDSARQLSNTQKKEIANVLSDNEKKPALTAAVADVRMNKAGENTVLQSHTKLTPVLRRNTKPSTAVINNTNNDLAYNRILLKKTASNKARTKFFITQQPPINGESTPSLNDKILALSETFTASLIHSQSAEMCKTLQPRKILAKAVATVYSLAQSADKKGRSKWTYVVTVSGGLSKQVSNPLYFGTSGGQVALLGIGGPLPTADSSGSGSANTKSSKTFSAGFYMRKPVNKRWSIQAGLSYTYMSYTSSVGRRIDSLARYYFNGVQLFSDSYFQPVSFINVSQVYFIQDYVNRVHLLQLPFEVQYNLGHKRQWSVLGGVSAGYLLGSNALVYKSNPPAYISSSEAFNKLLLSIHSGISYTNRKGYPFSAGLQFSYGANSFIKKSINDQHLVSSQLFLNIPFKK